MKKALNDNPNPPYFTPKELSERFKIHPGTLANWRLRGFGPRYKKIGRAVRYPAKAVLDWELKHWG